MLDLERIETVLKDKEREKSQFASYNINMKNVNFDSLMIDRIQLSEHDIAYIYTTFKELQRMVWSASTWTSYVLVEHHIKLKNTINQLYMRISSMLEYNFNLIYLTDKLALCASFYRYLIAKAAL